MHHLPLAAGHDDLAASSAGLRVGSAWAFRAGLRPGARRRRVPERACAGARPAAAGAEPRRGDFRDPTDEVALTSRYGLDPRVIARVALHGGRMRIVCSIDESTAARDAAEIAGQLARRMRAELVYVHSVTGESTERLGARSHRRCDLLIVGYTPRARFASALLGEAHRRLVRDAACPVMLVPAGARLRAGTGIVLGYNLPSISSAAAVAAGRLAAALDSSARGRTRGCRRGAWPSDGRAAPRRGSTPHRGGRGRSREEARGGTRGTHGRSVRATGRSRRGARSRRDRDRQPAHRLAKHALSLRRDAAAESRAPSGACSTWTSCSACRMIAPRLAQWVGIDISAERRTTVREPSAADLLRHGHDDERNESDQT